MRKLTRKEKREITKLETHYRCTITKQRRSDYEARNLLGDLIASDLSVDALKYRLAELASADDTLTI